MRSVRPAPLAGRSGEAGPTCSTSSTATTMATCSPTCAARGQRRLAGPMMPLLDRARLLGRWRRRRPAGGLAAVRRHHRRPPPHLGPAGPRPGLDRRSGDGGDPAKLLARRPAAARRGRRCHRNDPGADRHRRRGDTGDAGDGRARSAGRRRRRLDRPDVAGHRRRPRGAASPGPAASSSSASGTRSSTSPTRTGCAVPTSCAGCGTLADAGLVLRPDRPAAPALRGHSRRDGRTQL